MFYKKYFIYWFEKVLILKFLEGFEYMIYRFDLNFLIYCVMVFGDKSVIVKEVIYKIVFNFIYYFDKWYVKIWKCFIIN